MTKKQFSRNLCLMIICTIFLFCFSACNHRADNETKTNTAKPIESRESNKESDSTEVAEYEAPEKEIEEKSGKVTPIHLGIDEMEWSNYENNGSSETIITFVPFLYPADATKYSSLAKAFETTYRWTEEKWEQRQNSAFEDVAFLPEDFKVDVREESKGQVLRADSRVVSIMALEYLDIGGAHPMDSMAINNFEPTTGEILAFEDVVLNTEKFFLLVKEKMEMEYPYVDASKLDEYKTMNPVKVNFAVGYMGVTIYFNTYTLGSYADGSQMITIYYDDAPDIFEIKYMETPDNYIINDNAYGMIQMDLDDDDDIEQRFIDIRGYKEEPTNEYSLMKYECKLAVDEKRYDIGETYGDCLGYLVHYEGKYYYYALLGTEYFRNLVIIDLDTGKTLDTNQEIGIAAGEYLGADNGYRYVRYRAFTDVDFFEAKETIGDSYVSVFAEYKLLENGMPEKLSERYATDGVDISDVDKEIEAMVVDYNGSSTGEKTVLSTGDHVLLAYTDGESYIDVQKIEENLLSWDDDYEIYRYQPLKLQVDVEKPFYRVETSDVIAVFHGMNIGHNPEKLSMQDLLGEWTLTGYMIDGYTETPEENGMDSNLKIYETDGYVMDYYYSSVWGDYKIEQKGIPLEKVNTEPDMYNGWNDFKVSFTLPDSSAVDTYLYLVDKDTLRIFNEYREGEEYHVGTLSVYQRNK